MTRRARFAVVAVLTGVTAGTTALAVRTRSEAHVLLTNPRDTRRVPTETPAAFGLAYEDVSVRTADGLTLVGWFIPSRNGATILFQHGYKDHRGHLLGAAAVYARHGYGVLLTTVRAHDRSDGEAIAFGHQEMQDEDAWFAYVAARPDVDPARIGFVGVSMGASLAIQFAARNAGVRAVIADSSFSSLQDTVATSVTFFTDLPTFPFVPMIRFWMEREAGFSLDEIDAKRWIGRISPRPILLLQGGADVVVSPDSGRLLYEAAGEPKALWYEPAIGHARFFDDLPEEWEHRVIAFLDRWLDPR